MKNSFVRYGFVIAGLLNIGSVLLFTRGFSNDALFTVDPTVISRFGLLVVMLWGLAAIAVSTKALLSPTLSLVFAAEKLCYVTAWIYWNVSSTISLGTIYEKDVLSGLFFTTYGPFDFILMCFFGGTFWVARRATSDDGSVYP